MIHEIKISSGRAIEQEVVTDKWRNWVFEISTSPEHSSEETYKRLNIRNSLRVTKITPDIKFEIDFDRSNTRQRFTEEDLDTTYLRKGELSEAERLLRLGEQATGYQFQAGVGLSYTFGSIYNNIVNPMFGN